MKATNRRGILKSSALTPGLMSRKANTNPVWRCPLLLVMTGFGFRKLVAKAALCTAKSTEVFWR